MRIIYKATFPDGKVYIGCTAYFVRRKRQHKRCNGSAPYFHDAIKEFGFDCIVWSVLEKCNSDYRARAAERRQINKHKSADKRYGYNILKGDKNGKKHSPIQTRKEHSKATKRKMSMSQKRRRLSESATRKIS